MRRDARALTARNHTEGRFYPRVTYPYACERAQKCAAVLVFKAHRLDLRRRGGGAVRGLARGRLQERVDVRLPGKGNSKLPWRKAGPPNQLDD